MKDRNAAEVAGNCSIRKGMKVDKSNLAIWTQQSPAFQYKGMIKVTFLAGLCNSAEASRQDAEGFLTTSLKPSIHAGFKPSSQTI